ncbi:hypothetical protein MTO96_027821 [Rhipicephalus appendiculatus]
MQSNQPSDRLEDLAPVHQPPLRGTAWALTPTPSAVGHFRRTVHLQDCNNPGCVRSELRLHRSNAVEPTLGQARGSGPGSSTTTSRDSVGTHTDSIGGGSLSENGATQPSS